MAKMSRRALKVSVRDHRDTVKEILMPGLQLLRKHHVSTIIGTGIVFVNWSANASLGK